MSATIDHLKPALLPAAPFLFFLKEGCMVNFSNHSARCGAVVALSPTCGGKPARLMGFTTGKKSVLSRAVGAALRGGSEAGSLVKIGQTRFEICCFAADSLGKSRGISTARRFTGCRRLASGAGAGAVVPVLTEGGRGSYARRGRSYLIHSTEEKIFTLPIPL